MSIQEILMSAFTAVITAVVPVLATFLVNYIKSKSAELQAKTNNAYIDTTISSIENIATTIVTSLTQTVVETEKKNGTFTKEKAQEVLNIAKDQVLNAMTNETKSLVEKLYNMTIDQYVTAKIEEIVNVTKQNNVANKKI